MRQERHMGYEIKALSNLLHRKVIQFSNQLEDDEFTEMQTKLLGFLCHNKDQEIFQKDIEHVFYIRRSTASRLLKRLEESGMIIRQPVSRDARLKQVKTTPKADAAMQQITARIQKVEAALSEGLSQAEIDQFMATAEKLKQNLQKED